MLNHPDCYFECKNLSFDLGGKQLFSNLNLELIGPGIFQIEGDNGTGKSTLIKILAGYIDVPDTNIVYSLKKRVVSPANFKAGEFSFFTTTSLGLLNDLTGLEHIEMISRALKLDHRKVVDELNFFKEIEIFNEVLVKKVADYSQGMKQLLRLFLHLFFNPKVLFLDEPFLFLAPAAREICLKKITSLASSSIVFITDQYFQWTPEGAYKKIRLGKQ